MRRLLRPLATSAALLLTFASLAHAQSVEEIVDRMYDAFEEQAADVDNYTVEQDGMMGSSIRTYYEKEMVDGRSMFRMKQSSASMMGFSSSFIDDEIGQGDIYVIGPDLIEHGRYDGRENIDGNSVHVLVVDDMSALDMSPPESPDGMDFTPKSGRIYVDADLWVMRRMAIIGETVNDQGPQEITMTIDMKDYQEHGGLLIAHLMEMQVEGLEAMIDPEMEAQLAQMEEQLAALPEAQRAMMERMLGDQMEQITEMMSGAAAGGMAMEIRVTSVQINEGPPPQ